MMKLPHFAIVAPKWLNARFPGTEWVVLARYKWPTM